MLATSRKYLNPRQVGPSTDPSSNAATASTAAYRRIELAAEAPHVLPSRPAFMPFFENQSRTDLRRLYLEAWRKYRERLPLEPVEAQIAQVIAEHPEYHTLFEDGEVALSSDFTPESGNANPFLHMALHLAVRDQVATDRPTGIREAHVALAKRRGVHDAEHAIIEHLAEALWQSQRDGALPNEQLYLSRVKRLLRR